MTRLNVNPTRMVLGNLTKRLATSKRGHKLLKDKQDELMRRFIDAARQNRALRQEVETQLRQAFQAFSMASAATSPEMLNNAVASSEQRIRVSVTTTNVMSVRVPQFTFHRTGVEDSTGRADRSALYPYGYLQTTSELDRALERLNQSMDRLLELTQVEKSCQLMAEEIESTRRRVNALEYRTIPDLEETIHYIRMKLDENDRTTITRLLKVKDIISKADASSPKAQKEALGGPDADGAMRSLQRQAQARADRSRLTQLVQQHTKRGPEYL